MVYSPSVWLEHGHTSAQKVTLLNHAEGQYGEGISYMNAFPHGYYTINEADNRYLHTALHPLGASPSTNVDASKLDGYTLSEIIAMSVPAYCIGLFGAGDVPNGFAECDGSQGTPNYQGYIPKGAGSGVTPGTTGGSNSITPTANAFDSPDHTLADNEIPKHMHGYVDKQNNSTDPGGLTYDNQVYYFNGSDITRTTITMEPGGTTSRTAHKHAGSTFSWTGYKDSTGTSQAGALDIRPACRAVKFIMRLP